MRPRQPVQVAVVVAWPDTQEPNILEAARRVHHRSVQAANPVFTGAGVGLCCGAMTTAGRQVRRATVEDLPQLRELWRSQNLPWQQFERQFKDFQVVQTDSGRIVGSLGLQIEGTEGWLFAETFAPEGTVEALRAELWQRARIVAQNHGLVRVWTQFNDVFWQMQGFTAAGPEQLGKRPAAFAGVDGPWWVLPLRQESVAGLSLEQELAVFEQAQRAEREALQRKARVARAIALVVAVAVLGLIGVMTVRLLVAARRPVPVLQQGR